MGKKTIDEKEKEPLFQFFIFIFMYTQGFFFPSGFSLTDTDDSHDSKGSEGTIFYPNLPLPPSHKHSDIYLQLWI